MVTTPVAVTPGSSCQMTKQHVQVRQGRTDKKELYLKPLETQLVYVFVFLIYCNVTNIFFISSDLPFL